MLRQIFPARIWLLALIFMAGFSVVFYLVLGQGAKVSIVKRSLAHEQVLARSEASNIVSFFKTFGQSLAVLSRVDSIWKHDASTVKDMDAFVEEWRESGLVTGILLTGPKGTVQFHSNVVGIQSIGVDVADRDYYLWAKTQDKPGGFFIGKPVISLAGSSKGQTIVPVAAAIYQAGVFQGVLVAAVELEALTQRYLGLTKISPSTEIYLFDQRGTFLYSNPARDVVGLNVFDELGRRPFWGSVEIANSLKTQLTNFQEAQLQSGDRLLAYAPVNLGHQKWLLVITSPIQKPIYLRMGLVLLVTIVLMLIFGAAVSWDRQKTLSK